MKTSVTQPFLTILGIAIAACLLAPTAHAQSDNELRKQNQSLKTQVRELQEELEAALARIDQLTAEKARLIDELRANRSRRSGDPEPPPPPPVITVDESVPQASPRALQMAVLKSYEEETKGVEVSKLDRRDRRTHIAKLKHWASRVNREMKGTVQWHTRVEERNSGRLKLQALDPVSKAALGEPFWIELEASQMRRLRQASDRGEITDEILIHGTLSPQTRINASRESAGPFDKPPLLAPFVEFGFDLAVRSVSAPPEPEQDEQKRAG